MIGQLTPHSRITMTSKIHAQRREGSVPGDFGLQEVMEKDPMDARWGIGPYRHERHGPRGFITR
jgi:hypothetical protein